VLEIKVAQGCGPTGRTLEKLLHANGVQTGVAGQGVVCWGVRYKGDKKALNRMAGAYDKLQQLVKLREAGVSTLDAYERPPLQQELYPLIARNRHHVAGRDIRVCLQPEDAVFAFQHAGSEFLTKFIPRKAEYRVWVFRRRHLGTYEKYLAHPQRYRRFGCNARNGFAFRLLAEANVPRDSVELGAKALDALGLDFGAVDILVPKAGTPVVLEVNTAPGVEGDGRQVIRALARRIAAWEKHGYLRRNGDTDAV
jgi:glutathione synthase/RimK-type ligase-like ATP-grasp enzyme